MRKKANLDNDKLFGDIKELLIFRYVNIFLKSLHAYGLRKMIIEKKEGRRGISTREVGTDLSCTRERRKEKGRTSECKAKQRQVAGFY